MKGNSRIDAGLLILRIGLGLIVLVYGCQKAFGLFGGPGYAGTIGFMTKDLGIHPVFANLAIAAELFGALGVLFGLFTPVAAFGLACNFAVATYMRAKGSALADAFTKGDPTQMAGVFFPAILFFLSLGLVLLGSGKYSLDRKFFRKGR